MAAALSGGCNGEETKRVQVSETRSSDEIPSWEDFVTASTFRGEEGTYYIVEGDLPIQSLEELREYYQEHYVMRVDKLAVARFNNPDDAWQNGDQRNLEYCVSTTFPATGVWSRANTIAAMKAATARWAQVANVRFTYVPARDTDCVSGSGIPHNRFFKVAPKEIAGAFACAFFPISRSTCPSLDGSTVSATTSSAPPFSITRTLTHELGHVLGLMHEYARSDAPGSCPVQNGRFLTPYDATSIMQASSAICAGNPAENLSPLDGVGARALYGAPPAWIAALNLDDIL